MADRERWHTVQDVVEILKVHEQTVRRWIRTGELPAIALGDRAGYRISEDALREFTDQRRVGEELEIKKLVA
jgi:excisionase family DNA binding protein